METRYIYMDDTSLEDRIVDELARALQTGKTVVFPTETVYGIGANALNVASVQKIYQAKGRPSDNPLIVHIGDMEQVASYVTQVSPVAKALMAAFWPGPLTLVFQKKPCIPPAITGGLDTVAIRLPSHKVAQAILKASHIPVAAPSANISGRPSATDGAHVKEDLMGQVDYIVDGGPSPIGLESTVVDVTGDHPVILRPGGITKEMLENVVTHVSLDPHLKGAKTVPKSPGMKYRHYAPKGQLILVRGKDRQQVISYINDRLKEANETGEKVAVLAPEESKTSLYGEAVYSLGKENQPKEIAANLFRLLRLMDQYNMAKIYALELGEEELGLAIMNRLKKAAGGYVIDIDQV